MTLSLKELYKSTWGYLSGDRIYCHCRKWYYRRSKIWRNCQRKDRHTRAVRQCVEGSQLQCRLSLGQPQSRTREWRWLGSWWKASGGRQSTRRLRYQNDLQPPSCDHSRACSWVQLEDGTWFWAISEKLHKLHTCKWAINDVHMHPHCTYTLSTHEPELLSMISMHGWSYTWLAGHLR